MAILSWSLILLIGTLTGAGCVSPNTGVAPPGPYYGGTYQAPPSQYPYATPWVGTNTPWVFYQGDWFYNGLLYYFYGNQYGWAPYYAYPPTYIIRSAPWYETRWNIWYQQHPQYVQTFTQRYPYWRDHHYGQRYDQNFYNRYHPGQGGGWQKGFHGSVPAGPQSEGRRQVPPQMPPPEGRRPGPYQETHPSQVPPPERRRPLPGPVTQPEGRGAGPTQAAPPQGPGPVPAQQQQQRQWEQRHREQQLQQQQKQQQLQRQIQQAPQPQPQQQQQKQLQQQQHQQQQQRQPQQRPPQQEKKAPPQPGQP